MTPSDAGREPAGIPRRATGRSLIAWLRVASLLLALPLGSGCVVAVLGGAVAAAGGVAYARGELQSALNAPLPKLWLATQRAVESLEFRVDERRKDAVYGTLIATTSTDRRVQIRLERTSAAVTVIKIRVGTFGDEPLSRFILERIQAELENIPSDTPLEDEESGESS